VQRWCGGCPSCVEEPRPQFGSDEKTFAGRDLQVDTVVQEILGAVANERILRNRNDVQVLDIAMNLNNVGEFDLGRDAVLSVSWAKVLPQRNTEITQRNTEVETRCSRLQPNRDANIASLRV
jgi:hypothetical protein